MGRELESRLAKRGIRGLNIEDLLRAAREEGDTESMLRLQALEKMEKDIQGKMVLHHA